MNEQEKAQLLRRGSGDSMYIIWRVYANINNDRIMSVAAGVTFYVLLALFPAMAALVSLYGLFADPTVIGEHVTDLSGIMPEGGYADHWRPVEKSDLERQRYARFHVPAHARDLSVERKFGNEGHV